MATQVQNQSTAGKLNLLHTALRGNAIFSEANGLLLLVAGAPIAEFLGVAEAGLLMRIIGVALLGYGVFLYFFAERTLLGAGYLATAGDIAWVVGTIIVIVADPFGLSTAGKWAILFIGDAVALFAVAQIIGIRRLRRQ
jgi:hypothetical protein